MKFLILIWIFGIIATYRLWGELQWLAIIEALLVLSYGVHGDEKRTHDMTGSHDNTTATRLMWTFVLVAGIFIYSLFV